jgi:dTDP-4-amino-4,6-dideoxygalactose transaminase
MTRRIYLSPPDVGDRERARLLEAFDSGWIAPLGPHVDAFEKETAAKVGVAHAAALSSGTAALHLALEILGVTRGDEVLVPTLTFAATANAVKYTGATPVFVDADAATWTMDPARVAEALEDAVARTGRPPRAVITVDLYGQCADHDAIAEACARYDVPIVEDAAEALGATYKGRGAGSLGRIGILSFNGNKIITTSGGGMLLCDDEAVVRRAVHLATQAREPAAHYEHEDVGYNYRLSNLLAAVGRAQLEGLDGKVAARRAHNAAYRAALGDLPGVTFMPEASYGECTFWLTCLTVDPAALGCDREAIREQLSAEDIEARPVWKPMHLQPVYRDCRVIGGAVAEDLFARGLCLPSGSSLSEADRGRVVAAVRGAVG